MTCLSYAMENDFDKLQLDISSAYLYAGIKEDLYIRSPPHMNLPNTVFKLKKSLYGLKQSGANWYSLITNYLTTNCHLHSILGWPCVFTNKINNSQLLLCIFVDDIIIMTNDRKMSDSLINQLQSSFETKIINDGKSQSCQYDTLGMEVDYSKSVGIQIGMGQSLENKLIYI